MTFRIFQAIVLAFVRVHRAGPDFKFHVYLAKFMVLNEIFQNVSLFYVSNFLCTPDKKCQFVLKIGGIPYFIDLYLMGPAIIAAYITFSIKMLLSFWHSVGKFSFSKELIRKKCVAGDINTHPIQLATMTKRHGKTSLLRSKRRDFLMFCLFEPQNQKRNKN